MMKSEVPSAATPLIIDAPTTPEQENVVQHAGRLVFSILVVSIIVLAMSGAYALRYPVVGTHALLAFALGLRHAVDVDHLAAIDNVTRQLLSKGQRPVSVGFWFAVGHSSVVILLTLLIAGGYSMMWQQVQHGTTATMMLGLVASILSVCLLGGIGLLNARIAWQILRTWLELRAKHRTAEEQDAAAEQEGASALRTAISSLPFLQRVFDRVDRPEKMVLVGLLFGLGFDTATQVGLIGMAAISGSRGTIPPLVVLLFPLCFSCGMCLVDTLNGLLMLMTYRWANVRPLQKLFYNFVVTALSAFIALAIGSLEFLQMLAEQCDLKGVFWDSIQSVDMGTLGYMLICTFAGIFVFSVCWWYVHDRCVKPEVPLDAAHEEDLVTGGQ